MLSVAALAMSCVAVGILIGVLFIVFPGNDA